MHFFIYLLSLVLVALSTNGLGLPPMKTDSAITGGPVTHAEVPPAEGSCGLWCQAERRQINNSNTSNVASKIHPPRPTLGWSHSNLSYPLDLEPVKKGNLNDAALKNTAITNTQINPTAVTSTSFPVPTNNFTATCNIFCRRRIHHAEISKKWISKRQIDLAASEASQSS